MNSVDWNPTKATLRKFSWLCLPGFSLAGLIVLMRFHNFPVACLFFILAAVTPLLGLMNPAWVRPVYIGLTAVSLPIGFAVGNLVLAAIYFLAFTPTAIFFRIMGRDPLHLKHPGGTSTWADSTQLSRLPADYYRPF